MNRSRMAALAALFVFAGFGAYGQTALSGGQQKTLSGQGGVAASTGIPGSGLQIDSPDMSDRAILAMATEAYPATPGDVYTVSFLKAYQPEQLTLVVGGDGLINAGSFGTFDTRGRTFRQVKTQIEKKVLDSYPASSPSLLITSTGLFPVTISGEVAVSKTVTAWGLTRLSELVGSASTAYSSIRDVAVVSGSGKKTSFDLFAAQRDGDFSQDPYVRPLDSIIINRVSRRVAVSGDVHRPGTYQLLAGEGLADLVDCFASGILESARSDRLLITHKASDGAPEGESLVVDITATPQPELRDGDIVRVPSYEEYLPVVYVEGAVGGASVAIKADMAEGNADRVAQGSYAVLRVTYRKGQLLSQALKPLGDSISGSADLKRAFVTRKGQDEPIAVDLEKLLYAYNPADDLELQAEDRVVIPFGAMYVYVTGEVTKTSWVGVTGLTRLREALAPLVTNYSSLRDVAVKSEDGSEKRYDLFKAERYGELTQDPYLRPGDVVTLRKSERVVTLAGEVHRPGRYELLAGEGLSELLKLYGDGILETGRADLAVVTRKTSGANPESGVMLFDAVAENLPELSDGDSVRIPSREEYLPVVYVEGAIEKADKTAGANTAAADTEKENFPEDAYLEKRVVWRKGLRLSQTLAPLVAGFSESVDLRNAYVVRAKDQSVLHVDLDRLLFAHDTSIDATVEADDRIVIPFKTQSVFVSGEVSKAGFATVSGTQRLSEILKPYLMPYSSTRKVAVTSSEGRETVYDLFRAERFGDASQNPVLRPGDRIVVARAKRIVTLSGEVNRPGTYEVLPEEGLPELLSVSGGGVREFARPDRILVTRKASDGKPSGESVVVDVNEADPPALLDGDSVNVPSREEYLPIVYVEGATASGGYGIQRLLWREGLFVSRALKPITSSIPPAADLRKARLIRAKDGTEIAIDLEKLLFAYDPALDVVTEAGDRILLPYGSRDVYVTGEALRSGWIVADGTLRLSQAVKGFISPTSSLRRITVRGADGKERSYDLFHAERFGEAGQDPVLAPGDMVTLGRAGRIVTLEGEVSRPGSYELLPDEDFAALISVQGSGVRESAQADRVTVTHKATEGKPSGGVAVIDARPGAARNVTYELFDGDRVRVPSRDEYLPVVYIEGAVPGERVTQKADQAVLQTQASNYSVLRLAWRSGMRLSDALRPMRDSIPASADLKNAFVTKSSAAMPIQVNLEKILYTYDPSFDITLEPEDRVIIPLGSMYVFVTGEVSKSSWVGITGLTRLREAVTPLLTRWSSVRDVKILSENGAEQSYDLFSAERYGDLSQDPFLRPGDKVSVERLDRLVAIAGEVRRPGSYQLLAGEGMKELVERYADGLTEKANPTRMQVVRFISDSSAIGEKLQFDYSASPDFALNQYDSITVPAWQDLLPVVWFEGAIGVGAEGTTLEAAQRMPYTFFPGETVSQATHALRKSFSEVSDLSNAYISRKGARIPVDLAHFLYDRDDSSDLKLEANDVIVVPFRQFFVSVSGAVQTPGRYPYVPDRTWEYYVGLAGGFDTERNANNTLTVYDVSARKQPNDRLIQPEDNIVAASNSFLYSFYRVSAILTTILSAASLILALLP